jgi:hypothetical protein
LPRNVWKYRVHLKDVFYNDELSFEAKRDKIVYRLRRSGWLRSKEGVAYLHDLVDELADSADVFEFDYLWNLVYDEADRDRCWIALI